MRCNISKYKQGIAFILISLLWEESLPTMHRKTAQKEAQGLNIKACKNGIAPPTLLTEVVHSQGLRTCHFILPVSLTTLDGSSECHNLTVQLEHLKELVGGHHWITLVLLLLTLFLH